MNRLYLHASAPFAAFRPLQAGSYRMSLPILPPSAAWGLLLNLAAIESRQGLEQVTTQTRPGLPCLRLALGQISTPGRASLFQQLHSYPVGSSGQSLRARTHGAKYWIAPARREVLCQLEVLIGVQAPDSFFTRLRKGLAGELNSERYGLPFAGDNNFLFDRLQLLARPLPARWYVPVGADSPLGRGACRLTVRIDRKDSSKNLWVLMAPQQEPSDEPPESAWIWTPHQPPDSSVLTE